MNFTENLSKIKKLDSERNEIKYPLRRKTEQKNLMIEQFNNLNKIKMEELKRLKETPQPRMSFAKNI